MKALSGFFLALFLGGCAAVQPNRPMVSIAQITC